MNYVKEAENYLKHFKDLHNSVNRMDKQISRLVSKAGPKDITAMIMDERLGDGNHDETLNMLFEMQVLTDNKKKTEKKLHEIDDLLNKLSEKPGCEHYGKVLRQWYIEGVTEWEIAQELKYSERHVRRIKGQAIRRFAVMMFGIEPLKII